MTQSNFRVVQSGRFRDQHGGGSGSDGMDVENRLTKLEVRLDTILPMLATKSDVSEAKADIIKWLAGVAFAIVTIIVAVLAFMLNRAIPPQSPQQPTPIVIYPQAAPVPPQSNLTTPQPSQELKRGVNR